MRAALVILLFAATAHAGTFTKGGPATTDNDASCDISVMPAATLLLPYFEVNFARPENSIESETTIFTVTNNSEAPQIAHVTLWTDFGYPVFTFDLSLAAYGVESINLFDVIRRGRLAASCDGRPVEIPPALVLRMQSAFSFGQVPGCNTAGGRHTNAVGYATVDVVGACTSLTALDAAYFTDVIRFDNVLSGDYLQVNGDEDFAQGNALVHIRAIPEGGKGARNAPRTFYSRFLPASQPLLDARQPLPSVFNARWISGGATWFETSFKIWREGQSAAGAVCSALKATNAALPIYGVVRFDEEENPAIHQPAVIIGYPPTFIPTVPLTSLIDATSDDMPPNEQDAVSGWMYFNFDPVPNDAIAGQGWVVVSMRAEDRYSTDFDAVALGNGCSAPVPPTEIAGGPVTLGPAPNKRP